MRPYSEDLRRTLIAACEEGAMTRREMAELFHVSVAFVQNVLRRWRETGQLAAKPPAGGFPAAIRGPVADRVAQWVAEQPDLTLAELCARLGRQPGLPRAYLDDVPSVAAARAAAQTKSLHAAGPGPPSGLVAPGPRAGPAAAHLRR